MATSGSALLAMTYSYYDYDQTYVPLLLLYHPCYLLQCAVSLYSQEHAIECQLHSFIVSDLWSCIYRCVVYILFLPHQKRTRLRAKTTQLGKHRTCHRGGRHCIRIPAYLPCWLASWNRRGANQ